MPYEPKALTADDRNFALHMMWVGLASSLALLASKLFGLFHMVDMIAGGFTAGTLIGLAFAGRQDEHFLGLVSFAARWALAVTGAWLFASIAPVSKDYVDDTSLGLVIVAATFHIAFAFARMKGNYDV